MNIVVADDHPLILEGLHKSISLEFSDATITCCSTKDALFETLKKLEITLLIQDIKFGTSDARDFLKALRTSYPSLKIIALSSLTDPFAIQETLNTGIEGYVLKSESTQELFYAINLVLNGEKFLSEGVLESLGKQNSTPLIPENIHLTGREKEVLREILAEKSTKEIAQSLFVTEKAVEHHRANLFSKLHVKNVTGLVKKALLLRLLED
jgi:DNA-binding NarL/FixJ family response regulator